MDVPALLAANDDLIGRIKLCHGADRSVFEQELMPFIRRFADYVGTLPCTQDNYFSQTGGMLRFGLEVALFTLQGADAHIVSARATISERRDLEPRWRLAAFLAGLCSPLHRALSHITVESGSGQTWPAYRQGLAAWLRDQGHPPFIVRWSPAPQETRSLCLLAMRHIVPDEALQHLAHGNGIVVPYLLAGVSGLPLARDTNLLHDLVKRATALVIDHELSATRRRTGRAIAGEHLDRYVLDAMRQLVASNPMWAPNQERSRVWVSDDGLFVLWPNAAAELRKQLDAEELPGMPSTPEAMAQALATAGVLALNAQGGVGWTISPPPGKSQFEALRFPCADTLLGSLPERPAPVAHPLLVFGADKPASAAATP